MKTVPIRLVMSLSVTSAGLLPLEARAQAPSCASFCEIEEPRYLDDSCAIQVDSLIQPFNDGNADFPGALCIRLFKNLPSSQGGVFVTQTCTGGVVWPGQESWRIILPPGWPLPGTHDFYVEAWLDPSGSGPSVWCNSIEPMQLPAISPGDNDNDGIDTCADNCPAIANPLQVNVDADGWGDACDPNRGDLDADGDVDTADLTAFRVCFAGKDVSSPPPGCSVTQFILSDLNQDNDVDTDDLRAFQVFFTGN